MATYLNRAYVCGADEGKPFQFIKNRLEKLGIETIGHAPKPSRVNVPISATMILVISDQNSHPLTEKAKNEADRLDIPIVTGPFKQWSILEQRITNRGLGSRSFNDVEEKEESVTPPTPQLSIVPAVEEKPVPPQENTSMAATVKPSISPNFAKGRAEYARQRREEQNKVLGLYREMLKLRNGDISQDEMNKLCHRWSMPGVDNEKGTLIRVELGFTRRKNPDRKAPRSRKRQAELRSQFDELIKTTPEEKLPICVAPEELLELSMPKKTVPVVAVPSTPPPPESKSLLDIKLFSTEQLLAELKRRRDEAKAVLAALEGVVKE